MWNVRGYVIIERIRTHWRCKWERGHPIWWWLYHLLHCPRNKSRRCWARSQLFAWWCNWRWTWSFCWLQWCSWGSDWKDIYIIADLIGPDLGIVDVVVLVGEVVGYHIVDFLLYERTDVVEDCLFLFSHARLYDSNSHSNIKMPSFACKHQLFLL